MDWFKLPTMWNGISYRSVMAAIIEGNKQVETQKEKGKASAGSLN